MADIAPLRALSFRDADLADVIAPPYDVINTADRVRLAGKSPHNIVHVDLPDGDGDKKYAHAASLLRTWRSNGVLTEADAPCLIRYAQTFAPPGGGAPVTREGFFALVRLEAYENRVILPHERTLSGPKVDRKKLFIETRAALSPVFLLFGDKDDRAGEILKKTPFSTSFSTDDGIRHELARVTDAGAIAEVKAALADAQLLIADGHHRYETALEYAGTVDDDRAQQGLPPRPRGSHRYVFAFLCNTERPGLSVFATHRLVHGMPAFDTEAFLNAARETFDVARAPTLTDALQPGASLVSAIEAHEPDAHAMVCAFPDGSAFILTLRSDVDLDTHPLLADVPAVLRRSDVVLLHNVLLEGAIGMTRAAQAAKTNLRYPQDPNAALAEVREGKAQVLFLLRPTPLALVRDVCRSGEVMPQKSTFFFPKVPTGLAIHVLDPDVAV